MQKRDYDHAIANFSQVFKIDPYFATAYYNRGASYYEKENFDTAIADLTQALKIDPSLTVAKELLGRANAKLGGTK
jgi:tetratricopeptide (TPR) repeat protein